MQIDMVRGLPFVAVFWYHWFALDRRRDQYRDIIIQAVVAVLLALTLNRAMASLLPMRARPMYDASSGFHPMSIAPVLNLESWSSFPSDNATFFFGLATGAYLLSRPLGVALWLYAAVIVCLPRVYMGLHYPSDIVVGALLGIGAVMILVNDLTRRALRCKQVRSWASRHPGMFAVLFGIISFELITVFDDVRDLLRGPVVMLHRFDFPLVSVGLALAAVGGVFVAIMALWRRSAQRRTGLTP
jgi:undecaprenyl-diphosphatase